MTDVFDNVVGTLSSPAGDCFELSTSDTSDLPRATKAIYIGISGDIVLRPVHGATDVAFLNVQAGTIIPIRVNAVRTTGTTASALVGLI
ncbi:MAG: hypothetical protein RIB52_00230 [Erythrobacter sp.]|uniref:spike base protein, RCAP_Rcc01079 family n=1 Tax=Erythrobacter sp. TaxID=1042 RepID=UPI0032EBB0D4